MLLRDRPYLGQLCTEHPPPSKYHHLCRAFNLHAGVFLLRLGLVPVELATLEEAVQIEVWNQVWRENYAQTILEFGDAEFTSSILAKAVQASPLTFDSHDDRARASSGSSHSGDVRSLTPASRERCTIT